VVTACARGVVALQHHAAGTDLRALQHREGAEDIVGVVPRYVVGVEESGVEFASELEVALWIPDVRWAIVATVACEGLQIL
jgi:hypothetical protein